MSILKSKKGYGGLKLKDGTIIYFDKNGEAVVSAKVADEVKDLKDYELIDEDKKPRKGRKRKGD